MWNAELAARQEAKDRARQGPPKGQPQRWVQLRHSVNTAIETFYSSYPHIRKSPSQNGEKGISACHLSLSCACIVSDFRSVHVVLATMGNRYNGMTVVYCW